jgi:L-threonylcarbamoyladenylate synthase
MFDTEIQNALNVLRSGGIILYPTDTIWGLGCDATNEEAVKKIYAIKRRDDTKSMIILLDNDAKLPSYVRQVPEQAWDLIEFSEKPLTIIYPEAKNLAKNIIAEDGSIGIRVTKDEFCKRLIEKFRKPIVSTSANISGENPPANFSQISDEIKTGVDYIVALRQDEKKTAQPSTIIKLGVKGEIEIIRGLPNPSKGGA